MCLTFRMKNELKCYSRTQLTIAKITFSEIENFIVSLFFSIYVAVLFHECTRKSLIWSHEGNARTAIETTFACHSYSLSLPTVIHYWHNNRHRLDELTSLIVRSDTCSDRTHHTIEFDHICIYMLERNGWKQYIHIHKWKNLKIKTVQPTKCRNKTEKNSYVFAPFEKKNDDERKKS